MPRHGGNAAALLPFSMSRRSRILDFLFYATLVAVSAGVAVACLRPALAETDMLRERRDALAAENRRLEAEIAALRARQAELATNSEYIEKIARDQGLVAPTEMVFVFQE